MSTGMFVGAGAAVGLAVGGLAGFGVSRVVQNRRRLRPASQTGTPAAPAIANASSATKSMAVVQPKGTHDIFSVKTHYLTRNSEFYTPLDRFATFLQFAEERASFQRVVEAIDNLLGMEVLLNTQDPISATAIPVVAQKARNQAKELLTSIVQFSQEQRPSPSKKKDMETIRDEMTQIMDEILQGMHQTIAAVPVA